jgi:hypothetical protein
MIQTILVVMWLFTIRYGVHTLLGMKHRRLYPLFRVRRSGGITRPLEPLDHGASQTQGGQEWLR